MLFGLHITYFNGPLYDTDMILKKIIMTSAI